MIDANFNLETGIGSGNVHINWAPVSRKHKQNNKINRNTRNLANDVINYSSSSPVKIEILRGKRDSRRWKTAEVDLMKKRRRRGRRRQRQGNTGGTDINQCMDRDRGQKPRQTIIFGKESRWNRDGIITDEWWNDKSELRFASHS